MCLLSNNVNDYYFVSQGKTSIPNVDDGEEFNITDVSNVGARKHSCTKPFAAHLVSSGLIGHKLHNTQFFLFDPHFSLIQVWQTLYEGLDGILTYYWPAYLLHSQVV